MNWESLEGMLTIEIDAVMTVAIAALLLLAGYSVKRKWKILGKYCIPAPVVGGFLFMFFTFLGYQTQTFSFTFDSFFQDPFMLAFFTTVGLGASFQLLKKGGFLLILYWIIAGILSVFQNIIGIGVGKLVGLEAPYSLLSSAISMIGGHGAASAYGSTFAEMGYSAAPLVGLAAATFGLISAVLIGGPVGRRLIVKYHLKPEEGASFESDLTSINASATESRTPLST